MAKKFRLEVNGKAIGELLRGPEVRADLQRRGNAIAASAGPGHSAELTFTDRAAVFIRTDTIEAMRAEARDRTLTRALDAGR